MATLWTVVGDVSFCGDIVDLWYELTILEEINVFLYTISLFSHKTPWFENGRLTDWMILGYLYQSLVVQHTCSI